MCYDPYVTCPSCGGSGRYWDVIQQKYLTCQNCGGAGCILGEGGSGPGGGGGVQPT